MFCFNILYPLSYNFFNLVNFYFILVRHQIIVFNYKKGAHNVVAVSKAGYDGCSSTPRNAKVYTSGKDQIRLVKGLNHFVCTLPGHCASGMKIQVFAT